MGKLILIRHGQTDMNKDQMYYGRMDVPINETGRKQAEKARETLINLKIDYDKIYSSNLKRAYETAKIVNYKNLEVETDEKIQEMDFGIFEGLCYEEIVEKYPEEMELLKKDWKTYSYVTGENPFMLQKRAVEFLESIDKSKDNMVVTHWGIICSLLSWLFSSELDSYWKFQIKNGGIAVIDFVDNNYPVLCSFNVGG
ncbi:histidine phosphatase family protein [Fusobacterium perfoetens]|uniref:histidine phosphatase family protein n=1 Tax=Fusobacterium perfoetens TaxID=852 RepID=UPI001F15E9B9|nr:histidine phosphatase family protein [Fusobacterium perfoetens]MCF2624853.1 histidine phosphatase family protein [Fusobacterium perfoetens]